MRINGYDSHQIVSAVQSASQRPIILCPNPGDAASPVIRISGNHSVTIGQSATWFHRVEEAVTPGETLICGYYDTDESLWYWVIEGDVDAARLSAALTAIDARRRQAEQAAAEQLLQQLGQNK